MWERKDFLGIKELTKEEILDLLQVSRLMKDQVFNNQKEIFRPLDGNMTTLFYENSTRTKHSFAVSGQNIGLKVTDLLVETSSVNKGETLYDTAVTIDQMGTDIIVMRHKESGAPRFVAKNCRASVINAGDGLNEHPTQALLDALTMLEFKGDFKGLNVCITGDVNHSRVARSNLYLLTKLGAEVTFTGPRTLLSSLMENLGAKVNYDIKDAVKNADVVMGLRVQLERQSGGFFPDLREYSKIYGIDETILSYAKKDALLMHPGPVNRGVELDRDIVDTEYSVIRDQVTNGVAVRMAILHRIMEVRKFLKLTA